MNSSRLLSQIRVTGRSPAAAQTKFGSFGFWSGAKVHFWRISARRASAAGPGPGRPRRG